MGRFNRISRVAVTGSTNDDMARILGEERARGLTLVADYQEQGAGRKGRAWLAPAGSALLCTIGLPDALPARHIWVVPFWAGLVVRAAVSKFGVGVTLQWPNDILMGKRKAAGILCVSRVVGELAWVGCGIGVNVRRPERADAIAEIAPPPAYLSDEAPDADRAVLLQAILREADEHYAMLQALPRIMREWEAAAQVPGTRYRILLDSEAVAFEATALRLITGGALLVDRGGVQHEIALADARVLRS